MDAARKYTVADYVLFKFLMISFGILLGVYFTQYHLVGMGNLYRICALDDLWDVQIYEMIISC